MYRASTPDRRYSNGGAMSKIGIFESPSLYLRVYESGIYFTSTFLPFTI